MPNPTGPNNQRAILLTLQAHTAELDGKYKEAYDLHAQAAKLLVNVVANGKKKSEERRKARLQLKAANDRQIMLQACINGLRPPPEPLPSLLTIQREVTHPTPGTILLSLVHMGRRVVLAEAPVSDQPDPQQQTLNSLPLLTPMLSTSLPKVTYHVYREIIRRFARVWFYFHVKNAEKTQILYTLQAMKRRRMQIPSCSMSRAAEYHNNSAVVVITPVCPRSDAAETRSVGRPFRIITDAGDIQESPDRLERYWNPRRFTYGGRRFIWRKNYTLMNHVNTLFEVKKEWPDPDSKTGKVLDEIHTRPLAWGENKLAKDKICTIHMVGGLDQRFREFILVSQITKQMVSVFS